MRVHNCILIIYICIYVYSCRVALQWPEVQVISVYISTVGRDRWWTLHPRPPAVTHVSWPRQVVLRHARAFMFVTCFMRVPLHCPLLLRKRSYTFMSHIVTAYTHVLHSLHSAASICSWSIELNWSMTCIGYFAHYSWPLFFNVDSVHICIQDNLRICR